jgi:hypothetical protein
MSKKMKSSVLVFFSCFILSFVLFQTSLLSHGSDEFIIEIQVSPNTLNIQNQGQWVTVHTDIPFKIVDGTTVALNDIEISWWKEDNQGYFVAKFLIGDITDLYVMGKLQLGENLLSLTGTTTLGVEFAGTETVTIIDVKSKSTGK